MNGQNPDNGGTSFLTILLALAAGAAGYAVVDRTILAKRRGEGADELDDIDAPVAALPAGKPRPIPQPRIIRVEVPRGVRVPEEFWTKLAEGGEEYYG